MKALGAIVVVLVVLLAGGAITSNLLSSDLAIQQTTDPSGDFLTATPDQAVAFILVTGFIIFNVLGAGLTLMIVFWLLNRHVTAARQAPSPDAA
ncbi:MAG: hypothetical protein F4X02_13730 [Chloroflexi bacterium]|nr:hypothetical protein [Chloroflexota bacterium]